ncbi:murein hydrolase activator EnvC family protein [Microbacteriaceae bacterium 4G12]
MKKKQSILSFVTAGTLLVFPTLPLAHAETNQDKLSNIQSQLDGKQQEIQNKQTQKQQLEQGVQELQKKLEEVTASITKNEQDLTRTKEEIQKTQAEIDQKNEHIAQLQIQIKKRQTLINERLQSLQEQPHTNLITEVLVNTKNFADLLSNIYSVSLVLNSDNDILKDQVQDQKTLEKEKQAVEEKKKQSQAAQESLQKQQQELAANQQQQQVLMQELHTKLAKTEEEIMSATEASSILEAQKRAVQQTIENEKSAAAAPKPAASSSSGSSGSNSNSSSGEINVSGFIRPAAGIITSGFMSDGRNHPGVDIAASGNVPIYAAADGVVIRSYLSTSYGNAVFISHRINGKTYTTVYAHMSSRAVSEGQVVKQGQQVGVMGSTGESTGQHLHFELHNGEWNEHKTNAIDPQQYIPGLR